ncbi:hypothetical protein ES705_41794 [subsurface metagenome]
MNGDTGYSLIMVGHSPGYIPLMALPGSPGMAQTGIPLLKKLWMILQMKALMVLSGMLPHLQRFM